jgi:hypothetical protein
MILLNRTNRLRNCQGKSRMGFSKENQDPSNIFGRVRAKGRYFTLVECTKVV